MTTTEQKKRRIFLFRLLICMPIRSLSFMPTGRPEFRWSLGRVLRLFHAHGDVGAPDAAEELPQLGALVGVDPHLVALFDCEGVDELANLRQSNVDAVAAEGVDIHLGQL